MEIEYRTQFGQLLEYYGLMGNAAEIGVAEGRNASTLIAHPSIAKLYLIDAWTHLNQKGDGHQPQSWHDGNFEEAKRRMRGFEHKAVFLKGMSTEMIKHIPDDSLIFAYVDCDHSKVGCLADLNAIYPKLKQGGILAGHDYLAPQYGVNEAVKEFVILLGKKDPYGVSRDIHQTEEDGDKSMVSFWFVKK